jgi:hypothetical protein
MSIFAFYFAAQLLREAGWPRKLGMFKGEGYDAAMVDVVFAQSIDWGAALGAGRPLLAHQMMAEMFRERDWEGEDAPDVKVFVEGKSESWSTVASPQEAVEPPQFAKGMATMSVEQFTDRKMMTAAEPFLFEALVWGLSYPDRFEAWYGAHLAHHESLLPEMRVAGLEIGESPSLEEFYEASEQIVRDYVQEIGPLPPVPPRLLADAEQLGWRV